MSHTTNVNIELRDIEAIKATAKRLNLKVVEGEHRLYSSVEKGLGIWLPGWHFPIVVKKNGKQVAYDNFNGRWGDMREFNKFRAYYGVEKAKAEARKKGYRVWEQINQKTGEIELRIQLKRW